MGFAWNLLGIENTPPAFNTTVQSIFPRLILELEEEVVGLVSVGSAHECVHEFLEVRNGCLSRAVGLSLHTRGLLERNLITKSKIINRLTHTVGQPVSAMYMVGLLATALACAMLFCWKKSYVQPAASSMVV